MITRRGEATWVGVVGELDIYTGEELVTVLGQCLEQQPGHLVVDLSAVSFCDGAGARALETTRELAVRSGTEFALTGVRAQTLTRVLEVTGLDLLFGLRQGPTTHPDSATR